MRSGALRIALIYLAVCLAWVALSDYMLGIYQHLLSPSAFILLNNGRRFVFLFVTAYLVYRMVRAHETKLVDSQKQARRTDNENKKLGSIMTKVNNFIIVTDTNNFITWVNNAFEDFTGYSFNDVGGYTAATFFADQETDIEILSVIQKKKKAFESFAAEIYCHKKNGEKFWVNGEYTPLFDSDEKFTGYIAVYNDITRLKQKEQEITRQNDQLREIAWLSSHEIRRPLANIIGLTNLIKVSPYMDEKLRILENINQSAGELDQIVHTINTKIRNELEQETQPQSEKESSRLDQL